MLPSSTQVQTVYGGGIIPTLRSLPSDLAKKTLCIDSTTLDVDVAREVAKDVIATGAWMVDAPVSGGVTGAKAGTLSFLVGGSEASFQAVHPVLSLMGQRIVHCGPAGAGLGAKICNKSVSSLTYQSVLSGFSFLCQFNLGSTTDSCRGGYDTWPKARAGSCCLKQRNRFFHGQLLVDLCEQPCAICVA
jgi:3-hydroxyisobutyrate dehydrogenase